METLWKQYHSEVVKALDLPVFKTSQLVAGESGLDNVIQWVHTVDVPDAHYDYSREGVLMLNSGVSLSTSEELQSNLVRQLHEKKFAG